MTPEDAGRYARKALETAWRGVAYPPEAIATVLAGLLANPNVHPDADAHAVLPTTQLPWPNDDEHVSPKREPKPDGFPTRPEPPVSGEWKWWTPDQGWTSGGTLGRPQDPREP